MSSGSLFLSLSLLHTQHMHTNFRWVQKEWITFAFGSISFRSWRKDCNAHVQDPGGGGQWSNAGGRVVLLVILLKNIELWPAGVQPLGDSVQYFVNLKSNSALKSNKSNNLLKVIFFHQIMSNISCFSTKIRISISDTDRWSHTDKQTKTKNINFKQDL